MRKHLIRESVKSERFSNWVKGKSCITLSLFVLIKNKCIYTILENFTKSFESFEEEEISRR